LGATQNILPEAHAFGNIAVCRGIEPEKIKRNRWRNRVLRTLLYMTYKETLNFLYSRLPVYHRVGKPAYKADLVNAKKLDEYFNHPHLKFKTLHVAGTNGKGSVSHMLASIFQEAGYKTGLYTSPHLKDFRERIRVDGEMISEEDVVSFVERHRLIIETVEPSFFEMTVAMAFEHFANKEIEVAVIEVGLGGRLDSTNIINPVLSVITNIGHDHLDLLGPDLVDVSREKAGIIKQSVPVIIGETQTCSEKIFNDKATELNSDIFFADRKYKCISGEFDVKTGIREIEILNKSSRSSIHVETPLGGSYQEKNVQTVIQAVDILRKGFEIKDSDLINGLRNVIRNTGLKGRWQIMGVDPLIICDTGHNKEGLEYVINQINNIHKSTLHVVVGFVNDKDLSLVLPLFPVTAVYYFTKASIPRALDENILWTNALEYGLKGQAYPHVKEALNAALKAAKGDDMIFIGGSNFIVAEIV
jgi:dihydrofolate synthase/folylpolyglutamate synthase